MTNQKEKREKVLFAGLAILALLLAGFLAYLLFGIKGADSTSLPVDDDKINFIAGDTTEGDIRKKEEAEIVATLNQAVDENEAALAFSTSLTFADGQAEGKFIFANGKNNKYAQMLEIRTIDTDQLIYSCGVKAGHKIESCKLLVDLPKGVYDCIMYLYTVDPATNDRIGTSKARMVVTILA
ncbi:MAG: hypothetical protein K0S76_162 [Herbinix sp.]|jgi:hypothetical protein|nr:hypothetical protein [Herbinix sp.]